ncbi:hypothetical protein BCV70DRAFT_159603 [Testicularia cyperi]|uniref:SIN1-domain-containing protein n=1 Tax=Testicularia cyperi TaxID=1882483 RepID=A0A317XUK3_9BASI|nr:hypothetical protein BCV70DRAFT_159603 [Testicularia cyperi]
MSLIVDPDYIIHSLRLAYLRRIDDHHGPRVITFPSVVAEHRPGGGVGPADGGVIESHFSTPDSLPSFASRTPASSALYNAYGTDSHVVIAGLTDPKRNPELASVYSPVPSASDLGPYGGFDARGARESRRSSVNDETCQGDGRRRAGNAGLRHTQTIYGPGRSGALGMRVNGRRASKRVSLGGSSSIPPSATAPHAHQSRQEAFAHGESQVRPSLPSSPKANNPQASSAATGAAIAVVSDGEQQTTRSANEDELASSLARAQRIAFALTSGHTDSGDTPTDNVVLGGPSDISSASPEISAAQHDSIYAESSTESNTALSSLGSAASLQIGSLELTSINAAILGDSHSPRDVRRPSDQSDPALTARSSPSRVRQGISPADAKDDVQPPKMVISGVAEDSDEASEADTTRLRLRQTRRTSAKKRGRAQLAQPTSQAGYFAGLRTSRAQVEQRHASRSTQSALSARLQKQDSGPENPFAAFYAGVAGRSGTAPSMTVDIFFPWSNARQAPSASPPSSGAIAVQPNTKSMKLNIRKDATMEEVIGYGLYCFVEEKWQPELEPLASQMTDEEREIKTTTIGWTLMIVEDGEVDDDFPAIDQSLQLGKFGGDEFAICRATPNQIKQHRDAYGSLVRRTPRVTVSKKADAAVGSATPSATHNPAISSTVTPTGVGGGGAVLANPGLAARLGVPGAGTQPHAGSLISVQGTPIFASGALSKSALGSSSQSIFLRVLVTPNPEVRYKTTLQVPSDMYLADVLEMICRKRHLSNVDEWALVVTDKSIVVPLDRTVESLQGNHDLALVRRSTLGALGGAGVLSGSSTNPNASIFKRYSAASDPNAPDNQPKYTKALDIAAAYKSYTVYRKSPMFGGRHNERSLTLDGDWLHIMPTDMKTFGKAASFHITSVVACKLSNKLVNGFKLVVSRDSPRDSKRYDFEADSARIAAEIVREINQLRAQNS